MALANPQPEPETPTKVGPGKGRPGGNPTLNPTKLTPDVQQKICAALSNHQSMTVAAALAGMKVQTVYQWLRLGNDEEEHEPFTSFYMAVQEALAISEGKLVQVIGKEALTDAKTAMQLLERRHRKDWGRIDTVEHTGAQAAIEIQLVWPQGIIPGAPTAELENVTDAEIVDDGSDAET